jgi:protein required for attachment to host cells
MKLENTVVIVADLGELKAFRVIEHEGVVENEEVTSHSLELIADENFISGRKKLGETLSDSSGNFNKGTLEDHNLKIEKEDSTIKEIAENIEKIVNEVKPEQLFLAFPKEHNNELKDKLGHQSKIVLVKSIAADLVKTKKEEILSHFE